MSDSSPVPSSSPAARSASADARGVLGVEAREVRGVAHGRAAAEDGDRASEVRRAVGQPRELALHAAGDLLRPERAQPGGDVVGGGDLLGRELTDERAEQERVPAVTA